MNDGQTDRQTYRQLQWIHSALNLLSVAFGAGKGSLMA